MSLDKAALESLRLDHDPTRSGTRTHAAAASVVLVAAAVAAMVAVGCMAGPELRGARQDRDRSKRPPALRMEPSSTRRATSWPGAWPL